MQRVLGAGRWRYPLAPSRPALQNASGQPLLHVSRRYHSIATGIATSIAPAPPTPSALPVPIQRNPDRLPRARFTTDAGRLLCPSHRNIHTRRRPRAPTTSIRKPCPCPRPRHSQQSMADLPRRTSAQVAAPSSIPPPPPLPPSKASYFSRFVTQPLTTAYGSRPSSAQTNRPNGGRPNPLVPKLLPG